VLARAAVALLLLAGAALVVFMQAPLCPTAFFLGIPCPGCGLTRATLALAQGKLALALHFHPLAPVVAPLFVGAIAQTLFDFVRGPVLAADPRRTLAPAWWNRAPGIALASAFGALVLGVWLARFAGYFGGPAPVESYHAWFARVNSR
jgi:Protein of unknown function (DUF2752)